MGVELIPVDRPAAPELAAPEAAEAEAETAPTAPDPLFRAEPEADPDEPEAAPVDRAEPEAAPEMDRVETEVDWTLTVEVDPDTRT